MITFLPSQSFTQCAQSLDDKRLNKQILEASQILNHLKSINSLGQIISLTSSPSYYHHPSTLMWINYENSLQHYIYSCIKEWIIRKKHSTRSLPPTTPDTPKPHWLCPELTQSHQSSLLQKHPHYLQFNWPSHKPTQYYWPYIWNKHKNTKIFIPISKYLEARYFTHDDYHNWLKQFKQP